MAVSKSQKIQAEIDKVKAKISEQQARLKELEQKKLEAENSEIVDIVERNYTTNREGAVRNGQLPPANWSIRRMTAHRLETGAVISYCYGSL